MFVALLLGPPGVEHLVDPHRHQIRSVCAGATKRAASPYTIFLNEEVRTARKKICAQWNVVSTDGPRMLCLNYPTSDFTVSPKEDRDPGQLDRQALQ